MILVATSVHIPKLGMLISCKIPVDILAQHLKGWKSFWSSWKRWSTSLKFIFIISNWVVCGKNQSLRYWWSVLEEVLPYRRFRVTEISLHEEMCYQVVLSTLIADRNGPTRRGRGKMKNMKCSVYSSGCVQWKWFWCTKGRRVAFLKAIYLYEFRFKLHLGWSIYRICFYDIYSQLPSSSSPFSI